MTTRNMYCRTCGAPLTAALYCNACGVSTRDQRIAGPARPTDHRRGRPPRGRIRAAVASIGVAIRRRRRRARVGGRSRVA